MPYDGLAMHIAAWELDRLLTGGRIEKITQPEKDEIHLTVRGGGVNHRLVMSAGAGNPRVHLTGRAKTSPLAAPAFCMALRRRLTGGRVASVRQHGMERVLEMTVEARNELGVPATLVLRAEVMGRHSNIILTEGGRVVDSVKRVARDKSRVREVLPGLPYAYPPDQGRANPLEMTEADFESALADGGGSLASHLASRLAGLSAATLRALLAGAADPDAPLSDLSADTRRRIAACLAGRLSALRDGPGRPTLIRVPGASEAADFFPFRSEAHPADWQQERETLQQAMDEYYALRDLRDRLRENASAMNDAVRRHLDRCRRKLDKQRRTLEDAGNMERYRLLGELLTGHIHALKKGMTSVTLPDWYDPGGGSVTIPLDPLRDGAGNAQQYFRKYRKARVALDLTRTLMDENEMEIGYLESQLHNLSACGSEAEIEEIRQELVREGYMKAARSPRRKDLPRSAPLHYRSADGFDIYVGRNNLQNDTLTLRFARADDLWLHTKEIPGSHVVIRARDGEVSDIALAAGALLAAWHSRARDSSSVPVDYTRRRNVKKPGGAKPGYVIYSANRTAVVTPDAARVARIEAVE